MTDWTSLPLSIEIDAALKLLNENGMRRAANRIRLIRKKRTPKTRKVMLAAARGRGKAIQWTIDHDTLARLLQEDGK